MLMAEGIYDNFKPKEILILSYTFHEGKDLACLVFLCISIRLAHIIGT